MSSKLPLLRNPLPPLARPLPPTPPKMEQYLHPKITQNPSFLHPATTRATYQHSPLFTTQKLGIPRAAATKISIFWYPESSIKNKAAQQRSSKAAKQHSSKVPRQQLSSQAAAKMPRYQDSFAREAIWSTYSDFPGLPETSKSTILVPE